MFTELYDPGHCITYKIVSAPSEGCASAQANQNLRRALCGQPGMKSVFR